MPHYTKHLTSLLIVTALATAIIACSKPEPKKSSFSSLQSLPTDALGFMAADIQYPSMKKFMESEPFRKYIQAAKTMGDGDPSIKEGMAAYWSVLDTLEILPKEGQPFEGYTELLSYIRPSTNGSIEGLFAYFSAAGNDPRTKVSGAKKVLTERKFAFTEVSLQGYEVIEIPLFTGESENPAAQFYRSTLGLTKVVLAANDKTLILATSQGAIEYFAQQKNSQAKILDDAFYKKTLSELDPASDRPVRIALDIQALAGRIAPSFNNNEAISNNEANGEAADVKKTLPFHTLVGVSDMGDTTISFNSKTSVIPKDKSQEEVFRALEGGKNHTLPYPVSIESALAFVIDGQTLTRLLPLTSSQIPPDGQTMAKSYLDLISSVAVGIAPSSTTSPLPEVAISLSTTNAEELYKKVKELQSLAPLPQGMGLRAGAVEGLTTEFLPTPLGVKVHLWKGKDRVVIAGGDEALLSVVQPAKGQLDSRGLVANTQKGTSAAIAGLVINYERIAALMTSINQTASMFGQTSAAIPEAQLNSMKAFGTIALSVGYEPGAASLVYAMEFPH